MDITQAQLAEIIRNIRGVSFARIDSVTEFRMKKTGNPFAGQVIKVSRIMAIVGNWTYKQSLINQAIRENVDTDFEIQPRKWGTRLENGIVEHNGKLYLEAKIERSIGSRIVFRNGHFIPENEMESIKTFAVKSSESKTQDTIEKKVILRDYAFDSIRRIKLNGITYKLVSK